MRKDLLSKKEDERLKRDLRGAILKVLMQKGKGFKILTWKEIQKKFILILVLGFILGWCGCELWGQFKTYQHLKMPVNLGTATYT